MKNFRKFLASLLLVALVFGLTACRKKENEPAKKDYSGVELTYYKVFDDEEVLAPAIQQYEADHPGLTIHYKKFSDFSEYQNQILNEMAEGEGPDIFSMQNTWFASNYRKIRPMPKDIGAPDDFAKVFVDTAYKDLVRPDENGDEQVYGVPMTVDTLALYYNKAQFEDRIPTRGQPSSTWEGIKDDVVQLTKTNSSFSRFEVSGIAMGRADNISRGVDILYLLFLQYGVKFYNDNISEATFAGQYGTASTATYPALDALDFYKSFADPKQKNYSWNEFAADDDAQKEVDAFASGKVSMIAGFSYTYEDILNEISVLSSRGVKTIDKNDIRIAPIPQIYDPEISKDKRVTYANYFAETVSKNSKNPDLAWDFLIYMTNKKNLEHYFDELHKPTSRRDMIADQSKDPVFGVFASQIGYAESFPILDYYRYKDIFAAVISQANSAAVTNGDLLNAQNLITEMLPKDGLIKEKKQSETVEPPLDDGEN